MTAIRQDLLEAVVSDLPQDALAASRGDALVKFIEDGLPTTRHEDWRYTDLTRAVSLSNDWLTRFDAGAPPQQRASDDRIDALRSQIDAHWIVIENGFVVDGSVEELRASGIELLRVGEDGVVRLYDSRAHLAALNGALLRDGLCLRTGADVTPEKPIGIVLADYATRDLSVTQSRVLLDIGENSRVAVLEFQLSAGEQQQFSNMFTQVDLNAGARLGLVRLQQRQKSHFSVNHLDVRLDRDAEFDCASFDFGGGLVRNDITADIIASGANLNLHGLYLASGKQHIDNHTRVDHRVGPARSHEEYRGILTGGARCVFNGKAVVHDGADGTDAHQSNHNLLLSDRAEIDTKPELEIYADDVKCSHGATVGQLDKAALFYLRSRGLDREEASRILTRAFAAGVLSALPVAAARDCIAAALDACLDATIDDQVQ